MKTQQRTNQLDLTTLIQMAEGIGVTVTPGSTPMAGFEAGPFEGGSTTDESASSELIDEGLGGWENSCPPVVVDTHQLVKLAQGMGFVVTEGKGHGVEEEFPAELVGGGAAKETPPCNTVVGFTAAGNSPAAAITNAKNGAQATYMCAGNCANRKSWVSNVTDRVVAAGGLRYNATVSIKCSK